MTAMRRCTTNTRYANKTTNPFILERISRRRTGVVGCESIIRTYFNKHASATSSITQAYACTVRATTVRRSTKIIRHGYVNNITHIK